METTSCREAELRPPSAGRARATRAMRVAPGGGARGPGRGRARAWRGRRPRSCRRRRRARPRGPAAAAGGEPGPRASARCGAPPRPRRSRARGGRSPCLPWNETSRAGTPTSGFDAPPANPVSRRPARRYCASATFPLCLCRAFWPFRASSSALPSCGALRVRDLRAPGPVLVVSRLLGRGGGGRLRGWGRRLGGGRGRVVDEVAVLAVVEAVLVGLRLHDGRLAGRGGGRRRLRGLGRRRGRGGAAAATAVVASARCSQGTDARIRAPPGVWLARRRRRSRRRGRGRRTRRGGSGSRREGSASADSTARRISVAVWKRWLGWRASAFITSASTASGMSRAGARLRGRSGLPLTLASRTAIELAPAKGRRAREHLVEHAAERVEVGAGVDGRAGRLLRRHVLGRAEEREARRALAGVGLAPSGSEAPRARPKSRSLTERPRPPASPPGEEEVGRLDVAVHQRGAVGDLERGEDLVARRASASRWPSGLLPREDAPRASRPRAAPSRRRAAPSVAWPTSCTATRPSCERRERVRASRRKRAPAMAPPPAEGPRRSAMILMRRAPAEVEVLRLVDDAARAAADLADEPVARAAEHVALAGGRGRGAGLGGGAGFLGEAERRGGVAGSPRPSRAAATRRANSRRLLPGSPGKSAPISWAMRARTPRSPPGSGGGGASRRARSAAAVRAAR